MPLDLSKDNISLYTIPVAYLLAYVPHLYTEVSFFRTFGRWHNVSPRGNVERAASKLTAAQLATFKRAAGAHTNGLEAFPLFGAAVLAGNWAQLSSAVLNKWSIIYLLLRALYNPVYIGGSTERLAAFRSLIWFASQGVSLYLLKLSGDAALGR
ncbi:hypothetical protein BCR35DRAFT_298367 [Leucosporidium creatinivorum]|uniref:Membrane-associated, eicosanoid/glutathione metabolism protein n=1 Tax=Leucosporidium creatinivorum TaxID=106004 RepID=A0A1Y2G4F1_9BASI|nr:hypothetical protein BCR35DRAFT_298367 [Leucosporidium creatinivorum]